MFTKNTPRTILEFGVPAFFKWLLCLGQAMQEEEFAKKEGVFGLVHLPQQATDKLKLKIWHIPNVKQKLKNQLTNNLNLHI